MVQKILSKRLRLRDDAQLKTTFVPLFYVFLRNFLKCHINPFVLYFRMKQKEKAHTRITVVLIKSMILVHLKSSSLILQRFRTPSDPYKYLLQTLSNLPFFFDVMKNLTFILSEPIVLKTILFTVFSNFVTYLLTIPT